MEQLVAHHQAERLASIFWGLWLLPLGVLILRSRALPRLIGILLLLGCAGYLVNFALPLLVPGYAATLLPILLVIPGAVGEGGTWLWLLAGAFRPCEREIARPVVKGS